MIINTKPILYWSFVAACLPSWIPKRFMNLCFTNNNPFLPDIPTPANKIICLPPTKQSVISVYSNFFGNPKKGITILKTGAIWLKTIRDKPNLFFLLKFYESVIYIIKLALKTDLKLHYICLKLELY